MKLPLLSVAAATFLLAALAPGQAQATFSVSVEDPGVLNSTALFSSYGVETFDSRVSGSFSSVFGGTGITGSFTNTTILPASQYGGAGGTGNYISDANGSFTVKINSPINYFGLWISALNSTNYLKFYSNNILVNSFNPKDLEAKIGSNPSYYGNPNSQFHGQDSSEIFAFVNFYDTGSTFDEIDVSGTGYESDNYTVGTFTSQTGTLIGVPEPISVALFGAGLAGIGFVKRRKSC